MTDVEIRAEFGGSFLDGAVDLAAVCVALDGGVQDAEAGLRRMKHFGCEKNATGTGTKGRCGGGEGAQGLEEAVAFEELEEGGGFAARDDEAVESFELLRFANKHRLRTDVLKSAGVCVVIALDGKHANAWPWLCCCGLLFWQILGLSLSRQSTHTGFVFTIPGSAGADFPRDLPRRGLSSCR